MQPPDFFLWFGFSIQLVKVETRYNNINKMYININKMNNSILWQPGKNLKKK